MLARSCEEHHHVPSTALGSREGQDHPTEHGIMRERGLPHSHALPRASWHLRNMEGQQ